MKESDFSVFIPVTLTKAGPGGDDPWRIGGLAATDARDIDGENIVMEGLDTSYLASGRAVFNWNHGDSPGDIVGEIDVFKKSKKDLYVEGFLYKGVQKANDIYDLMRTMAKSSKRRLGFSVEGKIRQREDNTIVKSWVKAVAITHEPVNPFTMADLVKSMAANEALPQTNNFSSALLFENNSEEEVWQLIPAGATVMAKSFNIGHTPNQGGLIVTKESLENDLRVNQIEEDKKKKIKKSLSFEEAMYFVQENGVTDFNKAKNIVNHAISKGEVDGDN